jgi:glutamate transport system permease protein
MTSVLYDEPGPVGRRRIWIGSVLSVVVLVGTLVIAVRRFADKGQFQSRRWQVVADSISYLRGGLFVTLRMAVVAVVLASLLGLVLSIGRVAERAAIRWVAGAWVEFFRAVPLLALVVFAFVGLPKYDINLSRFWCVVVALVLYNSAALCEVFRAGINSVDRGQREAATAIGLRWWPAMRIVVLPQGLRRMLPAYVSQMVTIVKDTSLGFVVGAQELLSRSRQLGVFKPPSVVAGLIVALVAYLAINLVLSRVAVSLERRTAPTRRPIRDTIKDSVLPTPL